MPKKRAEVYASDLVSVGSFNNQLAPQHPHLALKAILARLIGRELDRDLFASGSLALLCKSGNSTISEQAALS